MATLTQYNKFFVALLVPVVVQLLGRVGLNLDAAQVDALTVLITAALVYLVPNTPPPASATTPAPTPAPPPPSTQP